MRTFPKSDFYDLEELLTQLGTGEAAVTILSESGVPTPVVHTRMRPPHARMGPADDVDGTAKSSPLYLKYGTRLDSQSAREMLAARLEQAATTPGVAPTSERQKKAAEATGGGADAIGDFLQSSTRKTIQREIVRGLFGLLKRRI